jgi:hypothetical protein
VDLRRTAVVMEPAQSIFDALWQGDLAGQRSQGPSPVRKGWPRDMRIHRPE